MGMEFQNHRHRTRDEISPEERALIDAKLAEFAARGRAVTVPAGASGHLELWRYGLHIRGLKNGDAARIARVRSAMIAGAGTVEAIVERTGLSRQVAARLREIVIRVEGDFA